MFPRESHNIEMENLRPTLADATEEEKMFQQTDTTAEDVILSRSSENRQLDKSSPKMDNETKQVMNNLIWYETG